MGVSCHPQGGGWARISGLLSLEGFSHHLSPKTSLSGRFMPLWHFHSFFFFYSYLKIRETVPGAGREAVLCLHADNLTAPSSATGTGCHTHTRVSQELPAERPAEAGLLRACDRRQRCGDRAHSDTAARSARREEGRRACLGPQEPVRGERAAGLGPGMRYRGHPRLRYGPTSCTPAPQGEPQGAQLPAAGQRGFEKSTLRALSSPRR